MTGISQKVGNFSEQVWGDSMSVVNIAGQSPRFEDLGKPGLMQVCLALKGPLSADPGR
jgi:hypothetical protein